MSAKQLNIQTIALTTGGTVSISNGVPANPMLSVPSFDSIATEYRITGTQTLASNFIVAMTSPAENTRVRFSWVADATPGAFSVQILGKTIPADYLDKAFSITLSYSGVAWITEEFNLDLIQLGVLPGDRIASASIATSQLTNKAVNYAKFQDVTAYSMLVRDAGTAGVLSSVAVAAQSIIGRVAAGFVAITASVNGTVLKMTGGNIGFAQVDFNELAGTIAKPQIPDREVTLAKLDSTGLLAFKTSDTGTTAVTSEEVLFTYTIPAGLIANTGEGVRIKASGTTAANGHTKTIRIKVGGNTYALNGVTTAPSGENWFAQVEVYRAGATAAVGEGSLVVNDADEGVTIDSTGITWANINDVQVTGQNGTATVNDIVVKTVSVTLIR